MITLQALSIARHDTPCKLLAPQRRLNFDGIANVVLASSQQCIGAEITKPPATNVALFAMDGVAAVAAAETDFVHFLATAGATNHVTANFDDSVYGKQLEHIFTTRLHASQPGRSASWTECAAAAKTDTPTQSDTRKYIERYTETAELLLTSNELLTAAIGAKQLQRFQLGLDEGILLFFTLQGDEATTEMRVKDESGKQTATGQQASVVLHDPLLPKRRKCKTPSLTVPVKVQYSEFRITMLVRDVASGLKRATSADMICPLEHFDRTTSENLHACQQHLLETPGFGPELMAHFPHVGVSPTQDQSGGNQKQVNAGHLEDKELKYGGKRRFRIAMTCDVHDWARAITASFFMMQAMVGQMIAFAITERLPDKLPALRKIVGQRLRKMCRIRRTIPPHVVLSSCVFLVAGDCQFHFLYNQ